MMRINIWKNWPGGSLPQIIFVQYPKTYCTCSSLRWDSEPGAMVPEGLKEGLKADAEGPGARNSSSGSELLGSTGRTDGG